MSSTRKASSSATKSTAARGRRPGRPSIGNDELLDKALELFLEQGFERTSIDGIAAAAGIAKRTLYLRYPDKETLFKAALQRAIADWIVPEEQLFAVECDDLEETLLQIGRVLLRKVLAPDSLRLIRLTKAESIRVPEISSYAYQLGTDRTINYLADLFQRRMGALATELKDWSEAAIAFLYIVISGPPSMAAWGMPLSAERTEQHIQHSVRLFLYGMLPRPAATAERRAIPQSASKAQSGELSPATDHAGAATETTSLLELQQENRRLRKLLLASMLEVESLKELRETN